MTTAPTTKTTHELREGDIVRSHGMRLLIDQEIEVYDDTRATSALILNPEEVIEIGFVPRRWIERGRWRIQGNEKARWRIDAA